MGAAHKRIVTSQLPPFFTPESRQESRASCAFLRSLRPARDDDGSMPSFCVLFVVVLFGLAVAECALFVARSRWLFSLLFFLNHLSGIHTPNPTPTPSSLVPRSPQIGESKSKSNANG
jgi:hypothetical protein